MTTVAVTLAPDGLSYHVVCDTKHLTSFAVLVDVSDAEVRTAQNSSHGIACLLIIVGFDGVLTSLSKFDLQMTIPEAEAFALTIVTYIGCGISLFCLLLSIIFYLSYG